MRVHFIHKTNRSEAISASGAILARPPEIARNWHGSFRAMPNRVYLGFEDNCSRIGTPIHIIEQLNHELLVCDEDAIYPYWNRVSEESHYKGIYFKDMKETSRRRRLQKLSDQLGYVGAIASLLVIGTIAYKADIPIACLSFEKLSLPYGLPIGSDLSLQVAKENPEIWGAQFVHDENGEQEIPDKLVEQVTSILLGEDDPLLALLKLERERQENSPNRA